MSSFCLWRWGSSFLPGDLPASAIFKHAQLKIFTIQGAIFWGSTFWTPSPGSSILVCADPDVWPPPNLPLSPLNKRPHQPQGQKPWDQLWSLIATLHPMCQSVLSDLPVGVSKSNRFFPPGANHPYPYEAVQLRGDSNPAKNQTWTHGLGHEPTAF